MRGNYTDTSSYFTVYPYGEMVLKPGNYITWLPSNLSTGTFIMKGSTYNFSDYSGTFSFRGGSITNSAFKSNSDITAIETDVTLISTDAFRDCISITSVSLSDCREIGIRAFYSCYSLSYVYAPRVESIGVTCFEYCSSMSTIDLPNCSYIDKVGFGFCLSLNSISVPSCEYISSQAFYSCPLLTSIDLPSCSVIEYGAFQRCYGLSSVSVPVCEYIGSSAFRNCSSLTSVDLPVCSFIGELAFSSCVNLTTIVVGSSSVCVLSNSNAFKWTGITPLEGSIIVPSSLYNAYKSAPEWSYFFNIPSGYIAWTPKSMSTGTFKMEGSTYNFSNYYGLFTNYDLPIFSYGVITNGAFQSTSITTLKTNARTIKEYAFADCTSLSEVSIPNCEWISDYAFTNTKIKSLYLPECSYINPTGAFKSCKSLTNASLPKLEYVTDDMFKDCIRLSEVSIPLVKHINYGGFYNCKKLKSIDVPSCDYVVGSQAFYGCTSLSQVSLYGTTGIGANAFDGCTAITSITLPSILEIHRFAFNSCTALSRVYISACETISNGAFADCTSLSSLTISGSSVCRLEAPGVGEYAIHFLGTPIASGTGKVYVPSSLITAYKNDSIWSSISGRIYPINN